MSASGNKPVMDAAALSESGLRFRDVFDPTDWPEQDRETHLVSGLLSTTLTVLAADPAVGKTHYACGIGAALLNGEQTFLGREVTRRLDSVVFVCTDADGANSVRRRIAPLVNEPDRVRAWASDYPTSGAVVWDDVVRKVRAMSPGLLIIDNVPGVVADPNDAGEAKAFTRPLLDLAEQGTAVLLLTHTSKPGMRGPAQGVNAPTGSRYWSAPARVKSSMTVRADGRRQVIAHNNDGESVQIDAHLDVLAGSPLWSPWSGNGSSPQQREGKLPAAERWDKLADRIVIEQPPGVDTLRRLGKHYAAEVGATVDTVRTNLNTRVRWTGDRWERIP
jgi:hypothetical protein